MTIALIILLAGIPLFLLLAPASSRQRAALGVQKRNEQIEPQIVVPLPASGSETYAFELQPRGEAHQHG
ncbi:hypothetical protein KZ483_08385 [Paenibacillus sp. sptzw28]|uniref:hypothetical protein n=1 Tax=Paenibacillus sp. sptzw28 TaxID=715179 RepID=UPI001C6F0773|nr:hypothetical protein [Paenibacillus sp. sptzw28]QYR22932.1 hypothetical protein KZ483_08385 [Paenibacillus sp. sptzw28]